LRDHRAVEDAARAADRVSKDEKNFFEKYGPEARAILADLLEKYAEHGTAQFVIPDVLKVPPISERGNVIEIAQLFGGPDELRQAVAELQAPVICRLARPYIKCKYLVQIGK
jgi:hypothetical protein